MTDLRSISINHHSIALTLPSQGGSTGGGGGPTGGGGTPGTLPSFSLQEWSGASSAPFARVGMGFVKGDVPSGYIPSISGASGALFTQLDQRAVWSDGSLRFGVAHIRDVTSFTANETRTYTMAPLAGSFNNTGSLTLAGVLAGHDFKVRFANVRTWDGSTHVTLGSGAFTSSLTAAIATATRITKVRSGPVCEGWVIWNMARDTSSNVDEANLKTYWHVDCWKNSDGSVFRIEVAAVVALDWYGGANKFRLDYDAAFVDGATTIATYAGVQHPYNSWWLTCRTTGDNNIGRRHWIGGSIPTLNYKPDQAYWIKSGLVQPYDLSLSPPSVTNSLLVYTPCMAGPTGNDSVEQYSGYHRLAIDGTGGYMGRGLIPKSDAVAFMRQTAFDTANARVNAHSGLSVPYHFRSNHNRTRPGESADVASTPIAQKLDNPNRAAGWDDCTADGMPSPVYAYYGYNDPTYTDGYVAPSGGTGVWQPGADASHLPNFSAFMYMLEGEIYHLEATLDLVSYSTIQSPYTYGFRALLLATDQLPNNGGAVYASLNIPQGKYGGLPGIWKPTNQRAIAFALNVLGYSAALISTDHVAYNYHQKWLAQVGDWIGGSLQYMPASQKAIGAFYPSSWNDGEPGQGNIPPWFPALIGLGAYNVYRMTDDTRYRDLGDCGVSLPLGIWASGRNYINDQYHVGDRPVAKDWVSGTNEFYAPGDVPAYNFDALVTDHANGWIQQNPEGGGQNQEGGSVAMTAGDQWSISTGRVLAPMAAPPSELTEGTRYYIRDLTISGSGANQVNTFRIYTTPTGGSPITFSANTVPDMTYGPPGTGFGVQWWPQDAVHPVAVNPPYIPLGDSYAPMASAAAEMAATCGNAAATTAILNSSRAFMAPVDKTFWMPFSMKAP